MTDDLRVRAGSTLVEDFQLRYPSDHPDYPGQPVTNVYSGSESLALKAWRGSTQAPATLASSAATWHDAAQGIIRLTLEDVDTTSLGAGLWRLSLTLATGSATLDVFDPPAVLTITNAPGVTADLDTYCSFADVLIEAPWVRELVATDPSLSSDLEEFRNVACDEFRHIVCNHYRPGNDRWETTLDHLLNQPPIRSPYEDDQLVGWLEDGRLVLTGPTGRRIKRWNALMTAYLVGKSQISQEGQTAYQEYARKCHAEARSILGTLVVGIDTTATADGVADIYIDLQAHDTLRG